MVLFSQTIRSDILEDSDLNGMCHDKLEVSTKGLTTVS
jgi:hypothetical protein